jgi:hypothetical protein
MITKDKKQAFFDGIKNRIIELFCESPDKTELQKKQNFIRYVRNSMIILTNHNPSEYDEYAAKLYDNVIKETKTTDYNLLLNELYEKVKIFDHIPSEEFKDRYMTTEEQEIYSQIIKE